MNSLSALVTFDWPKPQPLSCLQGFPVDSLSSTDVVMSLMQSPFQLPTNSKRIDINFSRGSCFGKTDAHVLWIGWHLQVTILNSNAMVKHQRSYNSLSLDASHQEQTVSTWTRATNSYRTSFPRFLTVEGHLRHFHPANGSRSELRWSWHL